MERLPVGFTRQIRTGAPALSQSTISILMKEASSRVGFTVTPHCYLLTVTPPEHMGNAQEYFVAGGVAGVVSRTVIAPIERVKILYQVSRASVSTSWLQLAPQIWREAALTRTSRSLRTVRTGYA